MKFNTVYLIKTKDGQEYEAELYQINPQYHYKAKHEQLERWRRTGNVPKKKRWIDCDQVVDWRIVKEEEHHESSKDK